MIVPSGSSCLDDDEGRPLSFTAKCSLSVALGGSQGRAFDGIMTDVLGRFFAPFAAALSFVADDEEPLVGRRQVDLKVRR
jgi:hypothetical protein